MLFISLDYYWFSTYTSSGRLRSSSAVFEGFRSWVGREIWSTWFYRAISWARTSEQQHFISSVKRILSGAIRYWMLLLPAARWPVALLRSNGGLIGDRSRWTRGSPWLFRLTCVSLPAKIRTMSSTMFRLVVAWEYPHFKHLYIFPQSRNCFNSLISGNSWS